jgi:hypothetical protein
MSFILQFAIVIILSNPQHFVLTYKQVAGDHPVVHAIVMLHLPK